MTQWEIGKADEEEQALSKQYQEKIEGLKKERDNKIKVLPAKAGQEIPLPPKPPEVLAKEKADAEKKAEEERAKKEKEKAEAKQKLKKEIIDILSGNSSMSLVEITRSLPYYKRNDPILMGKVSSALRELRVEGKITRTTYRGEAYYSIKY